MIGTKSSNYYLDYITKVQEQVIYIQNNPNILDKIQEDEELQQ